MTSHPGAEGDVGEGPLEPDGGRAGLVRALAHAASHDALTGLPNRTLLVERLEAALARHRRGEEEVAVLFCDLDGFKRINDGLGHRAGDEALVAAAERIRAAIRPTDTVARLGGDEFVVVCQGLLGQIEAMGIADRIRAAVEAPLTVAGQEVFLSTSVGVAFAADDGRDADGLMADADAAMYRAKQLGRGRCEPFDRRMRQRAAERLQAEADLRHAAERGELSLMLRPLVELASGRRRAVRPLVRWLRGGQMTVGPDRLAELAEEVGLSDRLAMWVLGRALAMPTGAPVVLRLPSALLARPGAIDEVAELIAGSGVDPAAVWLEVSEAAFANRGPAGARAAGPAGVDALRRLGVRVLVGGFGAGHASLAALRNPAVDGLTVDRTLVAGAVRHRPDRAIVAAVTRLADELGLEVLAEGVDTPEQARLLAELGCRTGEGRLFGAVEAPDPGTAGGQSVQAPVPTAAVSASLDCTLASTGGDASA